jgi:hypothetical protein
VARYVWIGITMAARRDRDGFTAKENKIVSKKSRLFDSKTQGLGLPQKSSKATITGRKPGKPKPTAGKGMNKNIVTKGGKAGLAIENKMRSAMGLPKLKTTGKKKSDATEKKYGTPSRKTAKQNDTFVKRYAKDAKKSGSTLKGNPELAKAIAPKSVSPRKRTVPVKPKGGRGLRGGGMGFGGGGLRSNVTK